MSASSVDIAIAAIRRLTTERALQPGDRLPPERDLAEQLGLARPTLREAIKRLNESGLLESRARSGTYVAQVDLGALFQVRMSLEPLAARLAAEHRTSEAVKEMEGLVRTMRVELDAPPVFAELDAQVHGAVWSASGNALLVDLLERLTEMSRLSRNVTSPSRRAREATLAHLQTLVSAIRRRDVELAERTMRSHLDALRDGEITESAGAASA